MPETLFPLHGEARFEVAGDVSFNAYLAIFFIVDACRAKRQIVACWLVVCRVDCVILVVRTDNMMHIFAVCVVRLSYSCQIGGGGKYIILGSIFFYVVVDFRHLLDDWSLYSFLLFVRFGWNMAHNSTLLYAS